MNNPFTTAEMTRSEYADFIAATINANWGDNPYGYLFEGAKSILADTMWACYNEDCDALNAAIENFRTYCADLLHSDEIAALDNEAIVAELNTVINVLDINRN